MKIFLAGCTFCLCAVSADAEISYWNPDQALAGADGAGDVGKAYNWSATPDGRGARPASLSDDGFESAALAPAWRFINADGAAGNGGFSQSGGKLRLSGRGQDFNQAQSYFTAIGRKDIQGSFDVTVRVDSQTRVSDWSKAGIVMANDLGNLDSGGLALVALTPKYGVIFGYNEAGSAKGRLTKTVSAGGLPLPWPVWLRLVRAADMVSAYYRTDSAAAWIPIGGTVPTIGLSSAVNSEVGLFTVAAEALAPAPQMVTAVFDDFRGGGGLASPDVDLRFDGSGPTAHSAAALTGDFAAGSLDFSGYYGPFSFNGKALSVAGKVRINAGMSVRAGGGSLVFTGNGGQDTLWTFSQDTLPALRKTGSATLVLMGGNLSAASLRIEAGTLDFNGQDLSLSGDLKIVNGDAASLLHLQGRTLKVGGNAAFSGRSAQERLGLNPGGIWILHVSGSLTADSAAIANSDASGFARGIAGNECQDGRGNKNWQFPAHPQPALILREPRDVFAKPGTKAVFSTQASGDAPLDYAWMREGDSAVLSRDSLLLLDSITAAQDHQRFYCIVANAAGKDTSYPALLRVRACDSSFVPPPDQTVMEGSGVRLAGTAGCASEVVWAPVSGPVPRLLDPGVDTLDFQAPRVRGDTTLVLKYNARFDSEWRSGNVAVTVKESIPDPIVGLPVLPVWNGDSPRSIRPNLSNAADLARFPQYPVRYQWSVTPLLSDSSLGGDSLLLANPPDDGNMVVTLCADNGGAVSCAMAGMEVRRITTSLRPAGRYPGPVWLAGAQLNWNVPGLVRILDWRGRRLWESRGAAGSSARIPWAAERALQMHTARMDFSASKQRSPQGTAITVSSSPLPGH